MRSHVERCRTSGISRHFFQKCYGRLRKYLPHGVHGAAEQFNSSRLVELVVLKLDQLVVRSLFSNSGAIGAPEQPRLGERL